VRPLWRAARPALLVLPAAVLLAACGIPTTGVVQAGGAATGIRQLVPGVPMLYFVKNGLPTPVQRTTGGPDGVEAAVKAVFAGPNAQERRDGLTTELPVLTATPTVRSSSSWVSIGLPAGTPRLNGTALQQLLCTVSSAPPAEVSRTEPMVMVYVAGPGDWRQNAEASRRDCAVAAR